MNPSFGPRKAKPSERQREAVNPIPATKIKALISFTIQGLFDSRHHPRQNPKGTT
jgi:hypothetical protein